MKSSRQITRAARRLFRLCLVNGTIDEARTKEVARRIALSGRRGSRAVLKHVLRLVRLDLGRWAEAIPSLETVLRLNPNFARAQRALGFALAKAGRRTEAILQYERYLRAVPADTEAREELRQLQR